MSATANGTAGGSSDAYAAHAVHTRAASFTDFDDHFFRLLEPLRRVDLPDDVRLMAAPYWADDPFDIWFPKRDGEWPVEEIGSRGI